MHPFRFQILELRDTSPQQWLRTWSACYAGDDDDAYWQLIRKPEPFTGEDFCQIGKWKDSAKTKGRWKENVASVAYPIWMQAAEETPACPAEHDLQSFLDSWASREYTDQYATSSRKKRFGLSRATTLLHFISRARYPIFDSRVRTALTRLRGKPEIPDKSAAYIDPYLSTFRDLMLLCESPDSRTLYKALFAFGAADFSRVAA